MGRKRIEARIKKEAVEAVKSGKLTQSEASRRLGISLIIAPNPAASSLTGKNFEKERSSSALFAREINLVMQPSFDCEQGINSQRTRRVTGDVPPFFQNATEVGFADSMNITNEYHARNASVA